MPAPSASDPPAVGSGGEPSYIPGLAAAPAARALGTDTAAPIWAPAASEPGGGWEKEGDNG